MLGQHGGNPYLQQMIDQSGQDTGRAVSASMGVRGLTGGSVHEQILAHELGKQSMDMRYNDYNNQQQLKAQAAGMAPGVAAGDAVQLQGLIGAAGAASGLPMDAASRYAGATGGLLGQYTTTKTSQPWGQVLANAASNAASAAAMGSDIRLKEDIRKVGKTDGGLPVYTYRYKGEAMVHMGVMAQEVAQMQPDALGPLIHGEYMSVKYGEVR